MRLALLGVATIALIGPAGCGVAAEEDEPSASTEDSLKVCAASKAIDWQIHMKEDFDAWDDKRFTKFDGTVPPRTTTCYRASNVTVSGGMLRIATKKESACGQPHTGGAVDTYGKFWTGKYFKAEIRAKVSQEQGIFSAPLWFRPGTSAGAQNVGGEIDVVEVLGAGRSEKWDTAKIHTTLHADYSAPADVHEATKFSALGDDDGRGFHVYTVEKTPKGITFFIDGKYVAGWGCGHGDNDKRPAWFDRWFEENPQGWSIRIDNKVGGPWAGEPDISTKWGPDTELVVDYIKVWKPKS